MTPSSMRTHIKPLERADVGGALSFAWLLSGDADRAGASVLLSSKSDQRPVEPDLRAPAPYFHTAHVHIAHTHTFVDA